MKTEKDKLETLVSLATDLTAAISAQDRYNRLLQGLQKVIPYDAAALLRYEEGTLIPIASRGLSLEAMGRRYECSEHPRLEAICKADEPVRFPSGSPLPDPFDGLLIEEEHALERIHSCLGCPLHANDQLIGVLTADALDPNAFDHLDPSFIAAIAALAGSQLLTVNLFNALEESARRKGQIADDLMNDIRHRRGTEIIGNSELIRHLRREIGLVAGSDFTVLVLGETGVGKELVVAAIHASSSRRNEPMLYLNCAALPDTLAESELFGHTKGAFTGASADRAGKFEVADGGTLFLDEIGELSLPIQAKLLRAIQEGEIQRIGSEQLKRVNVRLLAATNRDLEKEVQAGRFRADLFHRLNVYPIRVPPLREHIEDLHLLTGYFSERIQRHLGTGPIRMSSRAMEKLKLYSWPGNVRELENTLSRAILNARSSVSAGEHIILEPRHFGVEVSHFDEGGPCSSSRQETSEDLPQPASLREMTVQFQKATIHRFLRKNNGNWAATARDLEMHRSNLHNLAKRLNMLER